MATSATVLAGEIIDTNPHTRVPWTIWAGVAAITSASIGGAWDVAWHRSIGRDSFLSAPHLAIYACGVIAAVVCGYLIFYTTFGSSSRLRSQSVSVLGFHAPLGAFIAAWGGIAMIVSAPFDNWWHAAYGLDVKIISPPHTLLILGVRAVSVGVIFLVLAALNRAEAQGENSLEDSARHRVLQRIFLYLGGLMVTGQMFFLLEETWDVELHGTGAYIAMGIALPVVFAVLHRASGSRWACTIAALVYTAFALAEIWLFPLVPATPKLGPVYNVVTHLIPAKFPILIVIPALVLDLLWSRMRGWKAWQIAAVSGVVFIAVLTAVEWPFASFLLSKASENRFFGTIYFDYNSRINGPDRMRQFINVSHGARLWNGLAMASACAIVSAWIGLTFGNWMKRVQR